MGYFRPFLISSHRALISHGWGRCWLGIKHSRHIGHHRGRLTLLKIVVWGITSPPVDEGGEAR